MEEALASVPRNFLAPVGHQRKKKKKGARAVGTECNRRRSAEDSHAAG